MRCARSARKSASRPQFHEQLTASALEKMQRSSTTPQESRSDDPQSSSRLDEIAPQFKKIRDEYFRELSNEPAAPARGERAPATPTAPAKGQGGGN